MALKEFLEHVDQEYCNLHQDPVTVDHIYRATKQIVQHVMDEIGRRKPHLNIKEVISVGSFVEGTKNCSPNEFDFMVCFDFLSRKENIQIEGAEGCKPGYMVAFLNVKGDDDRKSSIIRQLYGDICCIHHVGVRKEFIQVLGEVISHLSMKKILTPKGILVLKGSEILALELKWHKFKYEYKGPDVYNGFCEKDIPLDTSYLGIDVDIMPAISVEDFSILSEIQGFPSHIAEILENRKFHLVCKESGQSPSAPYLHISHATTEVFLVSRLNPIHKQCYKLLKYVLTNGTDVNRSMKDINLSSYVFKTAVLFHEYDKLCSGTPDIVTCCIEIIQYIRARFRQGVFPSFLMRTMNVWGQNYKIPITYSWRPTNLNNEICRFDWSLVLWFQLWRQFLGKALTIFQKIEMQQPTAEPESHVNRISQENPVQEKKKFQNEIVQKSRIPPKDHVQEKRISPDNPVTNCHGLAIYVPNKYDPFLDEFAILRKDASVIISEYSNTIHDKTERTEAEPPSERVWELVLPKFPEYLSRIESICGRKLSIPKENFDEA